jgi:RNA polymerase sigma-70 factor (ECF subfamily)
MMTPKNQHDDAHFASQVAQGDREAFITLYDLHAPRVYALALRMLGEQMAAEEVTQDTFLKLWTRANKFSAQKGNLLTWLLTITRRTAIDRIRLENRRPEFGNPTDPEDTWRFSPDPSSQTEEARWRSMHFALQELPPEQRQAIELAYYQGMSQSQIADYLKIPLGTIKTRVRLGMDKLRQIWLRDKSILE